MCVHVIYTFVSVCGIFVCTHDIRVYEQVYAHVIYEPVRVYIT